MQTRDAIYYVTLGSCRTTPHVTTGLQNKHPVVQPSQNRKTNLQYVLSRFRYVSFKEHTISSGELNWEPYDAIHETVSPNRFILLAFTSFCRQRFFVSERH
jgi:hypothetical protein